MANEQVIKSPFTINKNTSGVTYASSDIADSTNWETLLTYSVPLGVGIELTPANYFFADLKTTGATTITAGSSRLVKQNANATETRELWQGANGIFKDIGDEFQRPKLRIGATVSASEKLVFQIYNLGTTLDVSASNVYVECIQFYESI